MEQRTMAGTSAATADAGAGDARAPDETTHPWLIVVLAQQRSGTTAFERTLSLGEKVHSFEEVFHDVRMANYANYFNFREKMIKGNSRLSFNRSEHQLALWRGYVNFLRQETAKPFFMIDVKYNSWHHFNNVWYNTGSKPDMVDLVKSGRAKVVHIVRRDLFAQACSAVVAERRQKFHFKTAPKDQPADLVINPRGLLDRMQRSNAQTQLFRRFFADYEHCCELVYEEMFADSHLSAATRGRVSDLIGEDCDGGSEVPLSKATPPLSEVIANSREVVDFFGKTRFSDMVAENLCA